MALSFQEVHAASANELPSISILNVTDPRSGQSLGGSTLAETTSENKNCGATSTMVLIGASAASVVTILAIYVLICFRRYRYASELATPSIRPAHQRVISLIPFNHSSNTLEFSASAGTNVPQPLLPQIFKSSSMSAKDVVELHVTQDEPVRETLPTGQGTQPIRTTSVISCRSLFSTSFMMRDNYHSSLPCFAPFRPSRASGDGIVSTENELSGMRFSEQPQVVYSRKVSVWTPIEHQNVVWGDFSETSWSIGPYSDSETDIEWFTMPIGSSTNDEAFVLNRNQLPMLSDTIIDIEEEEKDIDGSSLDDALCRQGDSMSAMNTFSARSEQGTSVYDDESLSRRACGLRALDDRWKTDFSDETSPDKAEDLLFLDDSYYDGTCSLVSFDSDYESDSDENMQEEALENA